jgi:hypothetical protein
MLGTAAADVEPVVGAAPEAAAEAVNPNVPSMGWESELTTRQLTV